MKKQKLCACGFPQSSPVRHEHDRPAGFDPHLPIPISLTAGQWQEIYYALDSKMMAIKTGLMGPQLMRGENRKWISELADIMVEIESVVEV